MYVYNITLFRQEYCSIVFILICIVLQTPAKSSSDLLIMSFYSLDDSSSELSNTTNICMSLEKYLEYAKYLSNNIRISSEHSNDIFIVLDSSDDEPSNE